MGVAHLRVRSWICGSRLYAPRHTAAAVAILGPATEVVADIVPRLPVTAVRIAHPAGVAPRLMGAAVVDIMAVAEAADITAEAVVDTPAAAVDILVAAVTPVAADMAAAIAKKLGDAESLREAAT